MKALIDTHVLLWALFEPRRISSVAKKSIEMASNEVFVSALSFWEISLKYQLGKLELSGCFPDELPEQVRAMGLEIEEVSTNLMASFYRLPIEKHKDPFDRLLAWQAIQEGLVLITKDSAFSTYQSAGLKTLW